ncbi:DUF1049 domain-containing protein [Paraneptunicella aestuarii]|uniref:lipopolysaccharide assembly protein LapA domain-containing protein n=1 Tax=Paraneptunicella aestuarii TaxID=2831148 RepID=UPI001E4DEBDB|nr:lipopolysaccharide assembly protein LapA domain-containing protein [Paraneptunicella aestuarii]UAA40399.1 DUF1049 domain-containing protein [Paraneptunicella aestuarii]
MTVLLLVIIAIALLIPAMVIGANNSAQVVLDYFVGTQSFTLSSLLALSFFVGVCFASIIWVIFCMKLKLQIGSLQRQRRKLLQESIK